MDSTNTAQPFAKRIAVGFSMALFGVVLVASTLGGLNAGSDDSLAAGKVRVAPENPPVTIGKPIVAPKIPVPVTTTAPVAATPVQAVTTPVPVTPPRSSCPPRASPPTRARSADPHRHP